MKKVILAIVVFYSITVVFFIGVTEHKTMFNDVKWTDVGTLLVTFLGFAFGFYTYFQWLGNKRKEDSYISAKRYLSAIDEVEENLHELAFHYNHICPTPGLLIEDKDVSIKRIEHLHNVWGNLYQSRRNLYKANRELAFWNVELVPDAKQNYDFLNQSLDNISVVSSALNSQLHHFICKDSSNMNEVIRHKERFDELQRSAYKVAQHRIDTGFKAMFRFEQ
ncbi:hypothetical protein G3496_04360 [Shewanella baltica]|uniref:hypothetical protein n=1 Tax=Shewanella baltica TaxID=62322 RepID=UPI00217D342F|nr:hypothetical protein [Shewanella baltica]MCS6134160.1 hypothetical protein [Shewanella baltica]